MKDYKNKNIVLFDGVCNLCNSSVNFIIDKNSKKDIQFASLQSEIGQKILKDFNLPTKDFNSFVLIQNENYFLKSTAALKTSKNLDGFWKYSYFLILVPKFIRDFFYDFIAKNRYKLFGKSEHCRIPTKELKERFLS